MCASCGPRNISQVLSQAFLICFGIAMATDSPWKREALRLWDTYHIVMFADCSLWEESEDDLYGIADKLVYVLDHENETYDFTHAGPFQSVDYFHGTHDGYVTGQMDDDEEVYAKDMINVGGWIERAVTRFQRRLRTRVRAFQIMNLRLLPRRLLGDQGIARLVASYMPYEMALPGRLRGV